MIKVIFNICLQIIILFVLFLAILYVFIQSKRNNYNKYVYIAINAFSHTYYI